MLLFPLALAGGVALGYLAGGKIEALGRLRIKAPAALLPALALQLVLGWVDPPLRGVFVDASYAIVGVWLVVNLRGRRGLFRLGVAVLALGWVSNLAVIVVNDGMPVSLAAARRAGVSRPSEALNARSIAKHVPADSSTRLRWLGDTIVVHRTIISIGDVFLCAGAFVAVAAAMTRSEHDRVTVRGS